MSTRFKAPLKSSSLFKYDLLTRSNSMQTFRNAQNKSSLPVSSSTNCLLNNNNNKNNNIQQQNETNSASNNNDNKNNNIEQLLKVFTRKKKTTQAFREANKMRLNNGQFRDYLNDFDLLVIDNKLKKKSLRSNTITFKCEIINFKLDNETKELFYEVQWNPKNM